ncbi:MAG: RDD family protein [Magnetococcales bacterium]|nr:RDD family protein [Magnetococcales bacterium]MBF0438749.1 RDD family protein [Magnetococcales bacterium]
MFCKQCGSQNESDAKFCSHCGVTMNLNQTVNTSVVTPEIPPIRYAGFWFRVLASVVDMVLSQVVIVVLAIPIGYALGASMAENHAGEEIQDVAWIMGNLLGILISWLWFTVAESSHWQASLGKKMLGLMVTDEQGQRIGFGRANARYWSKIISMLILFIGFIMVAFTEKKQGLHDKIADTLVIRRPPSA